MESTRQLRLNEGKRWKPRNQNRQEEEDGAGAIHPEGNHLMRQENEILGIKNKKLQAANDKLEEEKDLEGKLEKFKLMTQKQRQRKEEEQSPNQITTGKLLTLPLTVRKIGRELCIRNHARRH